MTEVFAFPGALQARGLRVGFVGRVPGVEVSRDKEETLAQLEEAHRAAVGRLGFSWNDLYLAEQVHGRAVAEVTEEAPRLTPGVDGLVTGRRGVVLGIHVADCAAVAVVDERTGALGLVHSGRKGSEEGVVAEALAQMGDRFGSRPEDLQVRISPCIRPPHYEVDFVPLILEQVRAAGVPDEQVEDCGICTAENVERYYSYRLEKGCTGRMLALLGWTRKEP